MIVIAHRINTIAELKALPTKYGVEVDLRASGKGHQIILGHEPFEGGDDFEEYMKHFKHAFAIFNIKEAGIEHKVIEIAKKYGVTKEKYFLLDVEYPFIFKTMKNKWDNSIAIRFSENEPAQLALNHANKVAWIWLDTLSKLPLTKSNYTKFKNANFKICLCCPSNLGRPQDIEKYQKYFAKNNIKLDAVMVEPPYLQKWS